MGQALHYVSDFQRFIDEFMKEHPEQLVVQKAGWDSFWDLQVDQESLHPRREDVVRDDHYGFF